MYLYRCIYTFWGRGWTCTSDTWPQEFEAAAGEFTFPVGPNFYLLHSTQ